MKIAALAYSLALVSFTIPTIVMAAKSSTPCQSLNATSLRGKGVLSDSDAYHTPVFWMDHLRGGKYCVDNFGGKSLECTFKDPGMIYINVQGRDFYFSAPDKATVKLELKDSRLSCSII